VVARKSGRTHKGKFLCELVGQFGIEHFPYVEDYPVEGVASRHPILLVESIPYEEIPVRKKKKCKACKKEFDNPHNRKFCSRKCYYKSHHMKAKVCKACKKKFRGPNKGFCSWECRQRFYRKERWETIKCVQCGKKIINVPKSKYRKFCSLSCSYKFKTI